MNVSRELRIAVAAEYMKRAKDILDAEKAAFLAENPVGTRKPVVSDITGPDDQPMPVGAVQIAKGRRSIARVEIVDEAAVIKWATGFYPTMPSPVESKLTEWARQDAIAAFKRGVDVPGVQEFPATVGAPTVSWRATQESPVDAYTLLEDMARRGVIDVAAVLELEVAGE